MRGWQNSKLVYSKTQKLALIEEIDFVDKLKAQNLISNTESEKKEISESKLNRLGKEGSSILVSMGKKSYGSKRR